MMPSLQERHSDLPTISRRKAKAGARREEYAVVPYLSAEPVGLSFK
jgi:hypothetical protein